MQVSVLKTIAVAVAVTCALAAVASVARAADATIAVFGHRYPHNVYYMETAMVGAVPGVTVEPQLSGFPQFQEKVRIGLSAQSDEIDIMACSGSKVREFAKAGWLEPLDDLWDKYRAEYNLDDMPANVVDNMRYEGKLYAVPFGMNTMFFFYRKDLFDEKGAEPPKTMEEYVELAKMFHTPRRSGTQLTMKMVETGLNELNWHFNAHGPGWLDDATFRPIFNQPHGIEAVETLIELAKYSAPGYLSNGNNEAMVNFQQDLAVMGLQWASRAKAMDNPEKSRVVGNIDFAVPPGGGSRVIVIGYCLPKFSDVDRETRFNGAARGVHRGENAGRCVLLHSVAPFGPVRPRDPGSQPPLRGSHGNHPGRQGRAAVARILGGRRVSRTAGSPGDDRRDGGEGSARHGSRRGDRAPAKAGLRSAVAGPKGG